MGEAGFLIAGAREMFCTEATTHTRDGGKCCTALCDLYGCENASFLTACLSKALCRRRSGWVQGKVYAVLS